MTDPLQALWAIEGTDTQPLTPKTARRRVQASKRRARQREVSEYLAALTVIAVFATYWIEAANGVIAAGCALVILGAVAVMVGLWKRRSVSARNPLVESQVDYLRDQLVRQRDALASVARWYLAPNVPGLAVFAAGHWIDQVSWAGTASASLVAVATLTVVALTFVAIWWVNRRAAAACQREIEALNRAFGIH